MASRSISRPPSFNMLRASSLKKQRYDVFVSFRGEDIRTNFADHLFAAFKRNGVHAFRDDQYLERGKVIGSDLLQAIEGSSVSIIVFSERYADSSWCLDELVKIMECKKQLDSVVIPVFYKVDPSDVRKQKGKSFEEAFANHEQVFKDDLEKVKRWRVAMSEAGHLSGFHLLDKHEAGFIQDIVKETMSKLKPDSSLATNEFVGMDLRLREINHRIGLGCDDVRFIGIHGMGGIGKTTLAKVLYGQISNNFDGSCFLENVRENSENNQFVSLQQKILSQILKETNFQVSDVDDGKGMIRYRLQHLKILLIIDDVNHVDQLEYLAGHFDWFGLGSRIIVTTRDEHVLFAHGIDNIYKVESLNKDEALQLLSLKAFKANNPPADYVELCIHVIRYCDNLPLAIKVIGSFLSSRSKDEWNSALERWREDPDKEVLNRLRISYDGLIETEKNIFLDIAFFFMGNRIETIEEILESSGFHPKIGIKVLIERCLVVSDKGELSMHDLLKEMAEKIVQSESINEPEKCSRLSGYTAAIVLNKNMGTEAIQGINYYFSLEKNTVISNLNPKVFTRMKKLRELRISNVNLPQGLAYLPNELRVLAWESYPLKSLPSSFEPENIVALQLNQSNVIRQLWKGTQVFKYKLKYVYLEHCPKLTKTPDFTYIPNVEILSFESCKSLGKLHSSIGHLRKLTYLCLINCINLVSIPDFVNLESLEYLHLRGCFRLEKFPKITGEMKSLEFVDISFTAIKEFPCSNFLSTKNLQTLFCQASPVTSLDFHILLGLKQHVTYKHGLISRFRLAFEEAVPFIDSLLSRFRLASEEPVPSKLHSITCLASLTWLDISYCSLGEKDIPSDFGCLSSLLILNLSGNYFVDLPTSIDQLSHLIRLYLDNCGRLKSLPQFPSSITWVSIRNCTLLESSAKFQSSIPFTFYGTNCLKLVEKEGGSNLAFATMKRYFHSSTFLTWSRYLNSETNLLPLTVREDPTCFNLLLPGSEIPKWFSLQSEGNSMTLEKPTHSPSNVLLGYALCCIFSARNWKTQLNQKASAFSMGFKDEVNFLHLNVNDSFRWSFPHGDPYDRMDDDVCDHIWLLFFPTRFLELHGVRDCSQIKVVFESHSGGVVVKQCAIRQVYEQDVKEFIDEQSV